MSSWIQLLIPPADATKEQIMRWRTFIFVGMSAVLLYIPVSLSMFASAGQVDNIERRQLVGLVLELDAQLCMRPGDDRILAQIADILAAYRQLTGEAFPLPLRCADD